MKLDKAKKQTVEFQIEVEGTNSKILPRLLFWDKNGMSVMFEGKLKNEDSRMKTAVFEVEKLDKIFETSEANAEIEVICENRYFKPWKSLIEFETPIVFKVNERLEPKITESSIRVEPLSVKQTPAPTPKPEANKPFLFKNKQGKLEEVFVLTVVEQKDHSVLLEVIDEKKRKRKLTIKSKR